MITVEICHNLFLQKLIMVEETKGGIDVASKAIENGDDDMFFINEDQFEDVVP